MELSRRKKLIWLLGIVLVGAPIVVTASWLVTQTMIEATSGEKFCGDCHSMKPMAAAYREDRHGGKNGRGFQAKCSQCHLPHGNKLHYFVRKGYNGMKDVFAELTYVDSINWEARRNDRERYVYDSGCLQCHSNLANAEPENELGMVKPKKFFAGLSVVAHKEYFAGTIKRQCVSCHIHVGHKNLSQHLNAAQSGS